MQAGIAVKTTLAALFLVLPLVSASAAPLHYPETRQVEQKDTFHGVAVADPYRWLETDVRQSAEVRSWVEAENRLSSEYLASVPEHQAIQDRLTQLWTYERRDLPRRLGN